MRNLFCCSDAAVIPLENSRVPATVVTTILSFVCPPLATTNYATSPDCQRHFEGWKRYPHTMRPSRPVLETVLAVAVRTSVSQGDSFRRWTGTTGLHDAASLKQLHRKRTGTSEFHKVKRVVCNFYFFLLFSLHPKLFVRDSFQNVPPFHTVAYIT